jgi:rubrerythrin
MVALGLFALFVGCLLAFMLDNIPRCRQCGTLWDVKSRHQMTQYPNPEDNLDTLCPLCQADADDYWRERWEAYYDGCM